MTQSERQNWWQEIEALKTAYRINLDGIEKLESKNKLILQETFAKVDEFESKMEGRVLLGIRGTPQ